MMRPLLSSRLSSLLLLVSLLLAVLPSGGAQHQPELVSSRRQGRRQLQTTDAPTAAAVPTPAPSAPTTMAPTVVPTPGNHTAAPTAALTAPPTPTPPAPSPTPPPPKPQPEPTGDGSEPHGLTAGQKFGVFLSVVIIGAAVFYIYRFYRRNYWGQGSVGGSAGALGGSGRRAVAPVRTAGGRGGQPLLQDEEWL